MAIEASELHSHSLGQVMLTGLHLGWELDSEYGKFKPRQDGKRSLENMLVWYCQGVRPKCKLEKFNTTGKQKIIVAYSFDGCCGDYNTVSDVMGSYYQYCPCYEARLSVTDKGIQRSCKRTELDELWNRHTQENGHNLMGMYECYWQKRYKTENISKQDLFEIFRYNPLPQKKKKLRLLQISKLGTLFGYFQCDFELPESLLWSFANFPPIFKNVNVDREDIRPLVEEYAEEGGPLTQHGRMQLSGYFSEIGTVITPLLLFYLDLGLVCKRRSVCVEHSNEMFQQIWPVCSKR